MEERITELESRIAFQDQTIRELDGELLLLARRLELVEKQVARLADELEASRDDIGPADEKPPHY